MPGPAPLLPHISHRRHPHAGANGRIREAPSNVVTLGPDNFDKVVMGTLLSPAGAKAQARPCWIAPAGL